MKIPPGHDAEPVVELEQLDILVLWLGVGEAYVTCRGGQECDGGGGRDEGRDEVRQAAGEGGGVPEVRT